MTKSFSETFPTVKLNSKLGIAIEPAVVERLVIGKTRRLLKIYLFSERMIDKEDIIGVENELKKQITPVEASDVRIIERFSLSDSFSPKMIIESYYNSLLLEFERFDHIMFLALKKADIKYPSEDEVCFVIEDTVMNHDKEAEFTEILYKLIKDRFSLSIKISIDYKEPSEDFRKIEDEERIKRQIREISERVLAGNENTGEEAGSAVNASKDSEKEQKPKEDKKPEKEKFEKKTFEKKPFEKKSFERRSYGPAKSDNPDSIYGQDFEDNFVALCDVLTEMEEVTVSGLITRVEPREIKNERTILSFDLTDFTDSITVKIFLKNDQVKEICEGIKEGAFVKVKGLTQMDRFENELTIGSVKGVKKGQDNRTTRKDYSVRKRVELHCHTKKSDMDGVSDAADIMKLADKWGMKALAITDHGVVQAFTDAFHAVDKVSPDFQLIYGTEGYLVDDLKKIVNNDRGQTLNDTFVVFDLETTGISAIKDKIIEIGAVKIKDGEIIDRFSSFVNPMEPIPYRIEKLTGINDSMVSEAHVIEEVLPEFVSFCGDAVLVAHNADFDVSFYKENCNRLGIKYNDTYIDTMRLAQSIVMDVAKYTLDALCKKFGIVLEGHHRAVNDAEVTASLFIKLVEMVKEKGALTLHDINALSATNIESIRRAHAYHVIIIAKNETGRINLYKLISDSHLLYFGGRPGRPKIPKSLLSKYREGLIIGSACEAGELFRAVVEEKPEEEIARIVSFYDYLEVQPLGNNNYMIEDEKNHPNVNSVEDLIELNKRIIALGDRFGKPVVATCDVHFLNPEDEIYRRILMAGQGFSDADNQAPLYLRTTEEMLAEFYYLPPEKAEEIVITNTNMIADMCDKISPVRPDKCPPIIPDSDRILTEICNRKAHELYGDPLPEIVQKRMQKELDSIINNGFAVMYIIAQKLVWKSVEDGYLVGSRGSVGSSFVAFLAGITEVNSLSPHYRCAKCHFVDFDSEEVKKFVGMSGCDMPDRICPVCKEKLIKDGFDIPFETFLGFNGDKEPDIDLNFSGEYQSKAHKYTEVIFGYGQTFRAGTITGVADKNAFGFVKKYYEERGVVKRTSEINRISQGCIGVRSSTGQHPGGIVVLPVGEDIYSFTPIQHPANKMDVPIITTHFDYHSIDHNLLKLDILGHDDPTIIRMLQDLTGVDPTTIPLDDKGVMSLFQSTEALGIKPEDMGGVRLGCLGIPEFGTDNAIQMLVETKPQSFSDLVRISGLSHGTNVWHGNAQTLIADGRATISTAICTRDDIMIYLINMGIEPGKAFNIMENVRKGKVAKGKCKNWEEWKEDMRAHNVPDWYLWSCELIEYMFPKAHAAAYVMMAWRIAYNKIYYPLAYYAAYFSIRAKAFSYEQMCLGREHLESYMKDFESRKDTLSTKEKDAYSDMKLVLEMYARGFTFAPLDIFKAKSRLFSITEDGKLMPSLTSVNGISETIGDAIVEACKDGPFLSRDEFIERTKTPKTVTAQMAELGLLGDIPESNQLSLFDFM